MSEVPRLSPPDNNESTVAHKVGAVGFSKSFRGYSPEEVHARIAQLTQALEQVQRALSQVSTEAVDARELRRAVEEQLDASRAVARRTQQQLDESVAERRGLVEAAERATFEHAHLLAAFDEVVLERAERVAYTEQLEQQLQRYEDTDRSVNQVLDAAERASTEFRNIAEREAQLLLDDARVRAREELFVNSAERDRLVHHARTIRSMLENAIAAIDERALRDPGEDPTG
jgi:cell division septum initiation protein DivIVA